MGHEGGHEHDHHHHDHHHEHEHHHHDAPARDELARGAGRGKIVFFDAPSGLAGDMIIAALVDLGVPSAVVTDAVAKLGLDGFHVHFGSRTRSGIVATSFDVHVEGAQPERTYAAVRRILEGAPLDPAVRERALATFATLARAEAKVHRASLDDVHFHEVGAVDALVDVVGSAAAIEHLGADVIVSPLPMGRGFVKARHGVLPLPAPATVEALAGLPTYDGGLDFEFVTPTGAAIVGAHAKRAARWPDCAPERVGWGAGRATLADRPNLLRVVLGVPTPARPGREPSDATHAVLEANLDDATGELLGHCIQALLDAGAVDAWATPIVMKKGRPAVTLSALVPLGQVEAASGAMLRESTTIGLRRHDVSRVERPRRTISVTTAFGAVPVKVAGGPYGPPQVKPEFDACVAAAREHAVPVREVLRAALEAASRSDLTARASP
jgi:uncharacterized protein (TIGR00299 family) protein